MSATFFSKIFSFPLFFQPSAIFREIRRRRAALLTFFFLSFSPAHETQNDLPLSFSFRAERTKGQKIKPRSPFYQLRSLDVKDRQFQENKFLLFSEFKFQEIVAIILFVNISRLH